MDRFTPTERTRFRRRPSRGSYDRALAHAILDEALSCHVGFVVDGQPHVIPTIHARLGDRLVFHGARAGRMLGALIGPLCATVTLMDGLVLARSAFHHSMNYRSVVVFGSGEELTEPDGKRRALEAIVEHVAPGRWSASRRPTENELAATRVVALPLDEVSVKVRSGPAIDDPEDLGLPCWAGVVPLRIVAGEPIPDAELAPGLEPPAAARFVRGGS